MNVIKKEFLEAKTILESFLAEDSNFEKIESAGRIMVDALKSGKKLISCGNGGSMSDAMHFAEELSGQFRDRRKALAAISISDPSHLTCAGNDFGFEHIFSRFIEAMGFQGDVLLAISTSGNSANVVNAALTAKEKGMKVVALTGKQGGKLAGIADVEVRAPQSTYSDRTQEIHIKIIHSLIHYIELNI
ncbi:MAG TPA: D-sedoheptulose 7-phosphate isomerase [Bacteroidales bacterium]|nr:D-sedoheptulose 7-phosphate isomerase [Bacteroidales bacterium]